VSERTRRVDHLLREEISTIIRRDLGDPRLGFVTITGVEVAPDLRHATVWASILGSEQERRATLQVLGRAMPFVRHQLGPLRLRRIPELHLREDDSAERGTRVMRILEQIEGGEGAPPANEMAAAVLADAPELPAPGAPAPELPAPHRPAEAAVSDTPEANVEPPLPPGYRRRVDRDALRRARQRRGR
jgi:ribosome-binding factor A